MYDKNKGSVSDYLYQRLLDGSFSFYNEVGWLSLQSVDGRDYAIKPIDFTLYNGNSGIVLAILYYSINKKNIERELIDKVLNYSFSYIEEFENSGISLPLGAFDGLYGLIYTLTNMAKSNMFLDINFKNIIQEMMRKSEPLLSEFEELDIIRGASGILGVLVTVYEVFENDVEIRTKAKQLCQKMVFKLLKARKQNNGLWIKDDIGYAHGNYGVAVQLIRYSKILSGFEKSSLVNEVKKGIKEVESQFENGQKYITRKNSKYYSWCNGVSGVLLAKHFILENSLVYDSYSTVINTQINKLIIDLTKHLGDDLSICHGLIGNLAIIDKTNINLSKVINLEKEIGLKIFTLKREQFDIDDWGLMTGESGMLLASLPDGLRLVSDILLLNSIKEK